MAMDVRLEKFRARLLNAGQFSIKRSSEFAWSVESDVCKIAFVLERFGEGNYNILVSDPRTDRPSASFFALRFVRGAHDVLPDAGSPENLAEIFNRYFPDVLAGDVSVFSEVEKLGKVFWVLWMEAMNLDDDDPIKIKMNAWDISWLADFKARQ